MPQGNVYVVASVADFPPGAQRVVPVGNRTVGVFNINGAFYALPNLCPHQLGPLCRGRVSGTLAASKETGWKLEWVQEGEIITCPWHALEYHIPTGQCLAHPEVRLRSYEVWVEGDQVMLRI
jgi:nitrite reductase/ring-hydroxylating ferredoxin subunit